MTIDEIFKLPLQEQIRELTKKKAFDIPQDEAVSMYDVTKHEVFDKRIRKDRTVVVDTGVKDPVSGDSIIREEYEPVARIGLAYEHLIVSRHVGFMLGNRLKFKTNIRDKTSDKNMQTVFDMFETIWNDCKLDYINKKMATILFSEMEVAEVWYFIEKPSLWNWLKKLTEIGNINYTIRHRILSYSNGDRMYPHFDKNNHMDAFTWGFTSEEDKADYYVVFSDRFITTYKIQGGNTEKVAVEKNITGKIPVVYWRIPRPIFLSIESIRTSQEKGFSDFCEQNEFTGSPVTKVWGAIKGFVKKGEKGKLIQFDGTKDTCDAEYLTNDNAPASIQIELQHKDSKIYEFTQTPNISFEQMKSIGATSGVALQLLFLDAHMAAEMNWGIFGEGIQRRCNLIKAAIGRALVPGLKNASEDLDITPVMTPYMPVDNASLINTLMTANGGEAIMSQRRSVELNPLIDDADTEIEIMKAEKAEAQINSMNQAALFGQMNEESPSEDSEDTNESEDENES